MLLGFLDQSPSILKESEAISAPIVTFSLKRALQNSGVPEWEKTFKVITTLPLFEKLNLERVPRGADIKKAYDEIYYYVVARNYVENQPTFFHHLAGTVFYETETQQQIYGKNHGQKAFATFKLVQKTIIEIEKALKESVFPVHVPVLREHKATLKFHYNALLAALKDVSDEIKERIKSRQKFDIDQQPFLIISDDEAFLAISIHPQTPSPQKTIQDKKTPKMLTSPSKKSVGRLGAKRLFSEISAVNDAAVALTCQEDFGVSAHPRTLLVHFDQLALTSSSKENEPDNIQSSSNKVRPYQRADKLS